MALVRFKIISFLLRLNIKAGKKLTYLLAKYEIDAEDDWTVDLKNIPNRIKSLLITDKSILQDRQNECSNCEYYVKSMGRCKKCGCLLKLKTRMALASCPIGKWGKVNNLKDGKQLINAAL